MKNNEKLISLYESLENGHSNVETWIEIVFLEIEEQGTNASQEIKKKTGNGFNQFMAKIISHSDKDELRKVYNHKDYSLLKSVFEELLIDPVKRQFTYLEGVDKH